VGGHVHLLPEFVPEIDANPVSFYWGRGKRVGQVWSLTRQSLPYFKVAVRARHVCPPHIFMIFRPGDAPG